MSTTDPNDPTGRSGDTPFTMERLREVLDTYGASAERWPAEERGAMLALLNNSAQARAEREDAYRLDSALDALRPPAPTPGLAQRIAAWPVAAATGGGAAPRSASSQIARVGALAASVLVGVLIGFGVGNYEPGQSSERRAAFGVPANDVEDKSGAVVYGPPPPPSIANPAFSGLGSAPMLAGSDIGVDDADAAEPVPLI